MVQTNLEGRMHAHTPKCHCDNHVSLDTAKPHSSAGSVADLRTGGHWFNTHLGQYSFQGLMMVIATGFIPLSPLSIVSTMVMWERSHWLGKNILQSTG